MNMLNRMVRFQHSGMMYTGTVVKVDTTTVQIQTAKYIYVTIPINDVKRIVE